jgi:hypothetical protein
MAVNGRQMQRRIALICEIRIIETRWIILDYALGQQDIIEDNSPSKTHGHRQLDPGVCYPRVSGEQDELLCHEVLYA